MRSAILNHRILTALAGAAVLAVACYVLARWQISRYEDKDVWATAIETNYARSAVPLDTVLATVATPLPDGRVWTRISATGQYAAGPPIYVRQRTQQSVVGMEILVPFHVDGGGVLVVDRGWVAAGRTAAELPPVPPAPSGPVTITGWLKPTEDAGTQLPAGQLATINLTDAATQLGQPVYAAYLVLADETVSGSSAAPARPTPLDAPIPDRGPHFAYAVQWVLVAILGLGFVVVLYRAQPVQAAARAAAQADRPVKVRIWDEEDG